MELSLCVIDAVDTYKNVEKWAKPEKAPLRAISLPMNPVIRKEAKGVVLIIRFVILSRDVDSLDTD